MNRDELRALVREVVREAVAGIKTAPPAAQAPAVAEPVGPEPTGPRAVEGRNRTETVRLATDKDLDVFVRKLLRLFESPKTRADLKTGRLSFRLSSTAGASAGATYRIDSGAVTERHIADLAGGTLVLGRRAVLTPLAREKARAMGIKIEKERK